MLVKTYGRDPAYDDTAGYADRSIVDSKRIHVIGHPDMEALGTSHVERQNLTLRMSIRRFTRLTNAYSKKIENHCHAVALFLLYYNFCRIHETIRVTPAMEAGLAGHLLDIGWIAELVADAAPPPKKRGPYKTRLPDPVEDLGSRPPAG